MKKLVLLTLLGTMFSFLPSSLAQSSYTLPTKAEDMYQLGQNYYYGQNGVEQDYSQAVYWFKKAAELDHAASQNYYGICYNNGYGVQKDLKKAFYWYTRSANQGNMYAQNNLGYCYKYGEGCEKDYNLAVFWFRKSVEQGYAMAQNNLGTMYYDGTGVSQDYAQAYQWFKKAADKWDKYGEYNLGRCYENGKGVSKDLNQAKQWYKKAADHGHKSAKEAYERLSAATTTTNIATNNTKPQQQTQQKSTQIDVIYADCSDLTKDEPELLPMGKNSSPIEYIARFEFGTDQITVKLVKVERTPNSKETIIMQGNFKPKNCVYKEKGNSIIISDDFGVLTVDPNLTSIMLERAYEGLLLDGYVLTPLGSKTLDNLLVVNEYASIKRLALEEQKKGNLSKKVKEVASRLKTYSYKNR